ncbi:YgfZ/GcvT domain-containing protein [Pseudoteredinibacter isoporae]|uniref:Aminomethyltransferase folate-binding domain-containing protein n=1 Tax=Pseudoteredinibacter isoporae TaxID=570281 RepID=A0A7X0JWW2_9GAMM|nr:folate-binding protein YgfZ [Pseudoteredinibacter isoporae]MBB6523702.1 hypothetical protein [Pseudoteredinibacter isoporae]NHO89205.1 folate-binding protein YgfZ [Pseudoteredinibacter isoporae]NIB22184.1 folate-binding protein YgfZ [Pseudoteredinibacter isoporae]
MNSWSELVQASNYTLLSSQSDAIDESTLLLCPLDHKSALEVIGPDSKSFLQGQLSCDLDEVSDTQWRLGAHCNHKGRMLSSFRASALGEEHIRLILRHNISENAHKALAKYAIFSKAELSVNSDLLGLGLSGTNAENQLQAWQLPRPKDGQCAEHNGVQILNISGDRFEIWTDSERMKNLLDQLKSEPLLVDNAYWRLLDIRAGIAEIEAGVEESIIPQMLNFNELDGINYQKGCYTGQEIIARMQYRGNLKRHTVRLLNKADNADDFDSTSLKSGAELFCADSKQAVGELVNIAISSEGIEALAVIKDDAAEKALALSPDGPWNFTVEPLPYAIT